MTGGPRLGLGMRVRFAVVLCIAVAVSWAFAGAAAALEPGVFVDPGSPAGKEYGVPLSDLRGAASGHMPVGNQTPPLFGIGISPAGAGGPTTAVGGGRRRSQATTGRRASAATRAANVGAAATGPSGASPVSGAALAELSHHGSSVPDVLLIASLVVLGGLGLGVGLGAARRRLG